MTLSGRIICVAAGVVAGLVLHGTDVPGLRSLAPAQAFAQAAASEPTPAPPVAPRTLDEILAEQTILTCWNDFLSEALGELRANTGLKSAFPAVIDGKSVFTLEEKDATVRSDLERLAKEGNLEIEYRGDTAVFWEKASDKEIALLQEKLVRGNTEERAEAVFDLAQLGDRRIYPILFKAIGDSDPVVSYWATAGLIGHVDTLAYGGDVKPVFDNLQKNLEASQFHGLHAAMGALVLGATRDARAVDVLANMARNARADGHRHFPDGRLPYAISGPRPPGTSTVVVCAIRGLALSGDARACDALTGMLKAADMRAAAAKALGEARCASAVDPLLAMLGDGESDARDAAAEALGKIGDPRASKNWRPFARAKRTRCPLGIGRDRGP